MKLLKQILSELQEIKKALQTIESSLEWKKSDEYTGVKQNIQYSRGQKVIHNDLGHGIIVSFSSMTGQPLVYFYNQKEIYGDNPVCVDRLSLTSQE